LNEQGGLIELGDSEEALSIGIFDFVNTEGMLSAGDNTLVPTESNGQVQIGDGTLVQGYLEASNTDLATELTKVIEAQRSFSYALKMMQTADELETTANNLR
jgi:flagellar basal-body rod protein FlgG